MIILYYYSNILAIVIIMKNTNMSSIYFECLVLKNWMLRLALAEGYVTTNN